MNYGKRICLRTAEDGSQDAGCPQMQGCETDETDDSQTKIRNLSEKKRRDQFNALINELSAVVSVGNRKMDKSTVMKAAIAFLRNHKEVTARSKAEESQDNWKPFFLPSEEFAHLMLEALDGFIMAFSTNGTILYSSDSVSPLLGHLPNEILNMTIYDLILEDNIAEIYQLFIACSATLALKPTTDNQISFQAYVRRGTMEPSETNTYELVRFTGRCRRWCPQERIQPQTGIDESKIAIVATARLQTPQLLRGISLADAAKNEFISRHSIEWKFLFLDHRAPPIIGYLPFEVLGTSGYDYYHLNDLERIVACHEALMHTGENTSCYYRFLTKGQQFIWLHTKYYVTYHQWNSKPGFIVCTHTVVSYSEAWSWLRTKNISNTSSTKKQLMPSPTQSSNSCSMTSQYMSSPTQSSNSHSMPTYYRISADADNCSRVPRVESIQQFSLTTQSVTTLCASSAIATTESSPIIEAQLENDIHGTSKLIHLLSAAHSPSITSSIPNIQITAPSEDEVSMQGRHNLAHDQHLLESPALERSLVTKMVPIATYQPVFQMSSNPTVESHYGEMPTPVLFSPIQIQLHEQLRKRHQVLQEQILLQQEELRLVHEQLVSQVLPYAPGKVPATQYSPIKTNGISLQASTTVAATICPEVNNIRLPHSIADVNVLPTESHIPVHQIPLLETMASTTMPLTPQQMPFASDLSEIDLYLNEVQAENL